MCPAQFRFRYIWKRAPSHKNVALPFGSAWGTTIAHYLVESSVSSLSASDLYSVFDADFQRELDESDVPVVYGKDESQESLTTTAHKMLDVFVRKVPVPEDVLGLEVAFSTFLRHPEDSEEELEVPIIGAFDAVVVVENKPVIWEFKSAARKYSEGQFEHMLQPAIYNVGARVFGYNELPVDVIVTTKTKTPDVQVERLKKNSRDERQLYDLAEHILRGVQAGVFPRNRGWQCGGCGYREECDR
jgi:CRISPR/Cas system-associated exonuclease Cas4 (RecB family)